MKDRGADEVEESHVHEKVDLTLCPHGRMAQ